MIYSSVLGAAPKCEYVPHGEPWARAKGDLIYAIVERYQRMLVRGLEGLMSQPRAADDFKRIRIRMKELRREKLSAQATATTGTSVAGHRGPCACGRSLFPDECDGSCKF